MAAILAEIFHASHEAHSRHLKVDDKRELIQSVARGDEIMPRPRAGDAASERSPALDARCPKQQDQYGCTKCSALAPSLLGAPGNSMSKGRTADTKDDSNQRPSTVKMPRQRRWQEPPDRTTSIPIRAADDQDGRGGGVAELTSMLSTPPIMHVHRRPTAGRAALRSNQVGVGERRCVLLRRPDLLEEERSTLLFGRAGLVEVGSIPASVVDG